MRINKRSLAVAALAVAATSGGAVAVARSGSDAPATDQGHVLIQETPEGGVPVADDEGALRGTVDADGLDEVSRVAGDFLFDHGLTLASEVDGKVVVNEDVQELSDAVMVLEALPVHDGAGKVVGHFGARFIEVRAYQEARVDAAKLVLDATGSPY